MTKREIVVSDMVGFYVAWRSSFNSANTPDAVRIARRLIDKHKIFKSSVYTVEVVIHEANKL